MTIYRTARPNRAFPRFLRGFTMIELMVAVAVLGVLASAGMPQFAKFLRDQRIKNMASDLRSDMQLARSESIRRNARVLVCPRSSASATTCATTVTATTWGNGWLVCHDTDSNGACDTSTATDPNPTRVRKGPTSPMTLSGPAATVTFLPTGAASASATFTMTSTGTSATRTLTVAPSGSVSSTST
jgi:type IV fimbrial biogenesis protein FimT